MITYWGGSIEVKYKAKMSKEENFNLWQEVMLEYYNQSKSPNAISEEPMGFINWLRENYTIIQLNQNKDEDTSKNI